MITLSSLENTHRPAKSSRRLGRGVGSKRGKTCGKGNKGDKCRNGHKFRFGYEGGALPLYKKIPTRGFTNGRFRSTRYAINLDEIDALFENGDLVNTHTLREKGVLPKGGVYELKVLGSGETKKKVTVEAHHFSETAKEKLDKHSISYRLVTVNKSE